MVLSAVGPLPARVLLTVGRRFDPALLGALPGNVHVESWVDQADVLAEADLVVCHGGSGTVLGALAYGVPLVVVPVFADQFENGRRVARSGAGICIASDEDVTDAGRTPVTEVAPRRITRAIATALAEDSYRVAAKGVASELAGCRGVKEALARLAMAVPGDS